MKHSTTAYVLSDGEKSIRFNSEKEACAYLGVSKCTVASAYRRNSMCKGYYVHRVGIATHKASQTRLFKIWEGMKERCYRSGHRYYKDYGGRGISVCSEWLGDDGFNNFRDWAMTHGYSDSLTIDRINTDGNYEPSNCRWATVKEQMNNRRNNHRVNINGENLTIAQCSDRYGIPRSTIRWRDINGRDVISGAYKEGEDA